MALTMVQCTDDNDENDVYVDLGLPSGVQWKAQNEPGYSDYTSFAISDLYYAMPTNEQWTELVEECQWTWTGNGCNVVGPNGNSIFLPADGYLDCSGNPVETPSVRGCYWSYTPYSALYGWYLFFDRSSQFLHSTDNCARLSIRLVKNPEN